VPLAARAKLAPAITVPAMRISPRARALHCHVLNHAPIMMDGTWILLAEAGGILALVLLFVWWTMRGKK